jgi:hypothetical protein
MQGIHFTKFQRWVVLSLLNFCIVAVLGVLLRYKMAFSLPVINYNYVLEAHSHFAFSGWISMAIFSAFVYILSESGYPVGKIYTFQFRLGQTASIGMLLGFSFEGYGRISIFFSMLFILFSWWFALQYWKDIGRSELPATIKRWARAALFFFGLSGLGIFILAYLKYHKIDSPDLYFNALYLFLHFQYNGWFSFGILALFFYTAHHLKINVDGVKEIFCFRLMFASCIPAYCLSVLWMNPPSWVFAIAAAAAVLQLGALIVFFLVLKKSWIYWTRLKFQTKLLWGISFIAFVVKFVLQTCSVIPSLGRLAFGFRSVIIVYLHLVMLGFISFFLIGFFVKEKLFRASSRMWKMGLFIFITGVLLMELLLLIQALSAIHNLGQSFASILFIAATTLLLGLLLMLVSQLKLMVNNGN